MNMGRTFGKSPRRPHGRPTKPIASRLWWTFHPGLTIALVLLGSGCDQAPKTSPALAPTLENNQADNIPIDGKDLSSSVAVRAFPKVAESKFPIVLNDVTGKSGINFVHHYDGQGEMFIAEPVASGMASLDYDLDGWIDLLFLNGAPIPFDPTKTKPNALYRNMGAMLFADVTQASRTGHLSYSTGVVVGDFDADGFPDVFVNNFGPNTLYRNNGDGTFDDATSLAGVAGQEQLGAGACFLDADGDGLLDLYVGNYVQQPVEKNVKRTTDGFPSYPGPLDFEGDFDAFFHNNGDGSFSDRSQEVGIRQIATTSMGTVAGDFDSDGDSDLIVVNDVERNLFFENDGTGNFIEVGIQRGIAFSQNAARNGNMGIDCGDYDRDGDLDLFTTTFSNDLPVLYRNDGIGNFADVTLASGAGRGLFPHANWGTAFLDIENDGDLDLFVANGHTDPNVQKWAYTTAWKVVNSMFVNNGKGLFEDAAARCGTGLAPVESSRGVVADDLDNDGDLDLVVLNALAACTVIRNDSPDVGNWLQLDLRGRSSCRDATGTRVTFEVDGKQYIDEVRAGRGYQSSYGQRLHFGLGNTQVIPALQLRWSDGQTQTLSNVNANQLLIVVQP